MPTLAPLDWIVIGLYFFVIFGIAYWAYLQERKGEETSADYFLAGRNVGWFVVGASLFASNIGSEHLIGLAGTGANSGVAVGQFELMASLVLLLLGWIFVPFYIKSGVFTMPEFLERRYSSAARWYLSLISIVGYVLTKISVTIYAGGIVFETLMGISFWTGAIFVVVATGIYTIFGGLRAVLYTDLIQAIVLIFGAVTVTLLGLAELGGWGALQSSVAPSFFDLWKPTTDPDFPWTGILFGAPILGVWYWCTDQFIVQRTLSAKNEDHARRGSIFAGFLKLLPLFIFVIPGVIAYALAQQGQLTLDQSDQALPALIGTLLPVGLRGIVVAGLMAALMSSLSSVFNSCSTLITWDVYRELKPRASEGELVWVGRLSTGVLVVLGLLWIPLMENISGQLYTYLQSVQGYIAPPIAAVFLMGIAWKRINAKGAIWSLGIGFVLGATRLILELINGAGRNGLPAGTAWETIAEINFLHFAVMLFVACMIVLIGVSLLTAAPSREKVAGLTFALAEETVAGQVETDQIAADLESDPLWRRWDLILTIVLIIGVGISWLYFTG
jgi:SSS family solute:Na+ symporter